MKGAIAVSAAFGVIVGIAITLVLSREQSTAVGPQQTRSSVTPPNVSVNRSRFFVVAYPRGASTTMRAKDDCGSVMALRRAVLVSLVELDDSHGLLGVWQDDKEFHVNIRDLTFRQPPQGGAQIQALNEAIKSWGTATDWRRVEVQVQKVGDEGEIVTLRLIDKRGRERLCQYSVEAGLPVPISTKR